MKKIIKIIVISLSVLFLSPCSAESIVEVPNPSIQVASNIAPGTKVEKGSTHEIYIYINEAPKNVTIHINKNSSSARRVKCAAYGYDNRCVAW